MPRTQPSGHVRIFFRPRAITPRRRRIRIEGAMSVESVRSVSGELPAQAAWMHKLARSLVRDASSADDVAQETTLAALRGGPREPEALRAWLRRVASNFALKRARDASQPCAQRLG